LAGAAELVALVEDMRARALRGINVNADDLVRMQLGHGWRLRLRCREHERLQRQQLLRYPVHHALERVVVGIAQDDARSLRIQATDACRRHHAGCS
jgi:hypothetical protein